MVREQEALCREALRETIANEYPISNYSLNGYKEDAVCLQQDGDVWVVYVGYRNKKDGLKSYSNIVEACLEVIRSITGGNMEKVNSLIDIFFSKIVTTKTA